MKKLFLTAVVIAAVIAVGSAVRPYWNKYWLEQDLEAVAVYGTKNRLDQTRSLLLTKIEEGGYPVREQDFIIEKDSKNTVTITVRYSDGISIFGRELKELYFTVSATAREIKAYY